MTVSERLGGALPLPVLLAFLFLQPNAADAELKMKRVMFMSPSARSEGAREFHPIADMDHDGLLEMAYGTGKYESTTTNPQRWEYGRFLPFNRWRILYADTIVFPPPNGLQPAYFFPCAMGDADRDGLSEILGHCYVFFDTNGVGGDSSFLCTMEQQFWSGPPDSITWLYLISRQGAIDLTPYMQGSLDQDSLDDFLTWTDYIEYFVMLENRGDNSYARTWIAPWRPTSTSLAFGDCDMDGRTEFIGGWLEDRVFVWETTGNDQYRCVWQDSGYLPNAGNDCFFGRDVNQNGKPEFFLSLARYMGGPLEYWTDYLFMWEAVADNRYARTCIDSVIRVGFPPYGRSMCGDVDGDGVDEVVWSPLGTVVVFDAQPGGAIEPVYSWVNDHGSETAWPPSVNIADVNRDGYSEIVIAAHLKVTVLEVEAVRLLSPNGGERLMPGDTCRISWLTFNPPRCDSVSLFLRTDSTYELDTIAHSLAPDDTPYIWTVPNIRAESAWVMAIAYGPGWQYDECDSAIRILGTGAVEEQPQRIYQTGLRVWPNPARGQMNVEYELAQAGPVELAVLDATGRKVAVLATGIHQAGRYSASLHQGGLGHDPKSADGFRSCPAPGVYFVRLVAGGQRLVRKVVVQ